MDERNLFELGLDGDNVKTIAENIILISETMATNLTYKPEEVSAGMFYALEFIIGSCPDPWKRKDLARRFSETFGLEVSRAHKKLKNGVRWAGWP